MICPWCNEEVSEVKVVYKTKKTHLIGEVVGKTKQHKLGKIKEVEYIVLGHKIQIKEVYEEVETIKCPECGHDEIGRNFYGVGKLLWDTEQN